ncbi:MAG TPA: hypothetical protein VIC24_00365 [Gemmatimonadaceae bacterium]
MFTCPDPAGGLLVLAPPVGVVGGVAGGVLGTESATGSEFAPGVGPLVPSPLGV